MCVKHEILKLMIQEQLSREEMVETLSEYRCAAIEFKKEFPSECNENGDYCEDCWKESIDKFIDYELPKEIMEV